MLRPTQPKRLTYNADAEELCGRLESALYSVANALEELRGYAQFTELFNALDPVLDDLEAAHRKYERIAEREAEENQQDMLREYWLDVI